MRSSIDRENLSLVTATSVARQAVSGSPQKPETGIGISDVTFADYAGWPRRFSSEWRIFNTTIAMLLLGLVTVALVPLRPHLNVIAVTLLFLILIVAISLFADRWTSIISSVVAFLLFDFFHILPFYTFEVAAPDHVLALFVFLGAAVITSQLVFRVRTQTQQALARGRQNEILYKLSQALIADIAVDDILRAVVERVAEVLGISTCAILMGETVAELQVRAALGPLPPLGNRDHAAIADWALVHRVPAGLGTGHRKISQPHGSRSTGSIRARIRMRGDTGIYVPIATPAHVLGLLYIGQPANERALSDDDQQMLLTFANQVALALERVRLSEEANRAEVLARSDELKSALLSAVSHDLRTPLASIKASVTGLLQPDIVWSKGDQHELLVAIDEETDRLTHLVSNMLDLTRIEAGELKPLMDWNDPEEVVRDVVRRAGGSMSDHSVVVCLPSGLPVVLFDYVEVAQVLTNLIENAGKYSPAGTPIEVSARAIDDVLEFSVADRGMGIPETEQRMIFDKFYRIGQPRGVPGAGIGLSICRGIVEAHGGRIWVENREGGGALFRFTLPISTDNRHDNRSGPWPRES